MPNIKSAKKRVLVNKTKAAQNKAAKSALKTDIKKFEAAVVEGNRSEAEGAYKAVSYTHLDVYKRQPVPAAASAGRCPPAGSGS